MTLELACGLAISFGLLTHSALLVRQSWHLCEWFKALEHHEATLSRLIEQLQADDAPPDTAEPVRDGASASLLDEQRRLQPAYRHHAPYIEDDGVWVAHGANGYVWKVFRWAHICADCLREERDERRVSRWWRRVTAWMSRVLAGGAA